MRTQYKSQANQKTVSLPGIAKDTKRNDMGHTGSNPF